MNVIFKENTKVAVLIWNAWYNSWLIYEPIIIRSNQIVTQWEKNFHFFLRFLHSEIKICPLELKKMQWMQKLQVKCWKEWRDFTVWNDQNFSPYFQNVKLVKEGEKAEGRKGGQDSLYPQTLSAPIQHHENFVPHPSP